MNQPQPKITSRLTYRIVGIEEDYEGPGKPGAIIQVIGTNKTFKKSIKELYNSADFSNGFSQLDLKEIGYLYAATIERKLHLIKNFSPTGQPISGWFLLVAISYTVFLVFSNLFGGKIAEVFGYPIPAVLALFPLTYIFDDILTEVYGYSASKRVIWCGFFANFLVLISTYIIVSLPASKYWSDQNSLEAILSTSPRIILASFIAYHAEFINSAVLSKLKVLTKGKQFWLRMTGSSLISNLLDSFLFCFIAFAGLIPHREVFRMILMQYIFKFSYEILLIPVTKAVCNFLKSIDSVDALDINANYNPYKLKG